MKTKLLHILIAVSICLLIGFLTGFATLSSVNDWYLSLKKPDYNPPNWVFAPVWTLLYILMGIAAGLISAKGFSHRSVKTALYYFGFQLLFNALWSVVFFGFKSPFWGLLVILILLALIAATIQWFGVVTKPAAYLLVPYLIWVCFATVLNYKIWEMN